MQAGGGPAAPRPTAASLAGGKGLLHALLVHVGPAGQAARAAAGEAWAAVCLAVEEILGDWFEALAHKAGPFASHAVLHTAHHNHNQRSLVL